MQTQPPSCSRNKCSPRCAPELFFVSYAIADRRPAFGATARKIDRVRSRSFLSPFFGIRDRFNLQVGKNISKAVTLRAARHDTVTFSRPIFRAIRSYDGALKKKGEKKMVFRRRGASLRWYLIAGYFDCVQSYFLSVSPVICMHVWGRVCLNAR